MYLRKSLSAMVFAASVAAFCCAGHGFSADITVNSAGWYTDANYQIYDDTGAPQGVWDSNSGNKVILNDSSNSLSISGYPVDGSVVNGLLEATAGSIINETSNALTVNTGSSIGDLIDLTLQTGSYLNINGGDVVIGTDDVLNDAVINQTAGNLNIDVTSLGEFSGNLQSLGGDLTLNNFSLVNVANIASDAIVTINGTVELNGSQVQMVLNGDGDVVDGTLNLNNGNLTIDGLNNFDATYSQTSGTAVISNLATSSNSTNSFRVQGGSVDFSNFTMNGLNDSIDNAVVNISNTFNINNGSLVLDANDSILSDAILTQNSGNITINGDFSGKKATSSVISAVNGNFNIINNGTLELNNANDNIDGNVNLQIAAGSTLDVSAGNITINDGDIFTGNVSISTNGNADILSNNADTIVFSGSTISQNGGVLNVNFSGATGVDKNLGSVVNINSGEANFTDVNSVGAGSSITGGNVNLVGSNLSFNSDVVGVINIDNASILSSTQKVTLSEGSNWNGTLVAKALDVGNANNLTILGSDAALISSNSTNTDAFNFNNVNSADDGLSVNINDGQFSLTNSNITIKNDTDNFNLSEINLSGSTLTVNKDLSVASGGNGINLNTSNLNANSINNFGDNAEISNSNITITAQNGNYSGNLKLSGNNTINVTKDAATNDFTYANGQFVVDDGITNLTGDTTISGAVNVVINSDAVLNIFDSTNVTFNGGSDYSNVVWNGTVNLNSSDATLVLNYIKDSDASAGALDANKTGILNALEGNLIINSDNVLLGNNDVIAENVNLTLLGDLDVSDNAQLNMNAASDVWNNSVINQTGGTVNIVGFETNTTDGRSINSDGGSLKLDNVTLNNSIDNITANTQVVVENNLALKDGSITLDSNDTLQNNSQINQTGGSLYLSGISTSDTQNTSINSTDGNLQIMSGGLTLNNANDLIVDSQTRGTIIDADAQLQINNGNVTLSNATIWDGEVITNENANLILNDTSKSAGGFLNAQEGNLTINGTSLVLNNSNDYIDEIVALNVASGSKMSVDLGQVTINENDSWNSTVVSNGGNLILKNASKNAGGSLEMTTAGQTTILGNYTTDNNDVINGGKFIVGDSSTISKLNVERDLDSSVAKEIYHNSILNIISGTTDLAENTIWQGDVNLNGGTLNYNKTILKEGMLNANTGNLNITGTGTVLNLDGSNDYITAETIVNLNEGSTLNINNIDAKVDLEGSDIWDGALNNLNGTLTLDGVQKTTDEKATYYQSGMIYGGVPQEGVLKLNNNSSLELTNGSSISGGIVYLNNSDLVLNNGAYNKAAIIMPGSSLSVIGGTHLDLDKSIVVPDFISVLNGGNLNIGSLSSQGNTVSVLNAIIDEPVNISLYSGNELYLYGDAQVTLDSNDLWEGQVAVISDEAYLTLKDINKTINNTSDFYQVYGTTELNNTTLTLKDASVFAGGNLDIGAGSVLNIERDVFELDNLSNSGLINTINNDFEYNYIAENYYVGSAENNTASHSLDIDVRSGETDAFLIGGDIIANAANANIAITNINLVNPSQQPIDSEIDFRVFYPLGTVDPNINFISVAPEINTPIGKYRFGYKGDNGLYSLKLTEFNPKVFRGQMTTAAQWMNQLSISNMIFDHMDVVSRQLLADGNNANEYASVDPLFAPYQYSTKDGGVWGKIYGGFETVAMTEDISFQNNSYGTIVGIDFPLKNLENGWKFIPTFFMAYNGANQRNYGIHAYQNGGQMGLMGTLYKGNFITSLLGYGGGYSNEMGVAGVKDRTGNWFAGAASKTAYNVELPANFIFQPNLFLSYNAFGKQNWETDFGMMGMNSGMLNGVNIAPGANLIWQKDTFSLYLGAQYMYNLYGKIDGRAGNVDLPDLEMRHGYMEYGIGVTKRFKDRLTGYLQLSFRNGGRTGIAPQGGLTWKF